jgi:hypothetical protein
LAKIFISYRHDDAPTAVAWITHTLDERFGADNVFEYKHHAQPSRDFRKVIGAAIRKCDVMLAIVGNRWKLGRGESASGIKGVDDWVRIEVETAIQLALPVIPVLVEGAIMPSQSDLPESLSDFAFFTGMTVETSNNRNFLRDMDALVTEIDKLAAEQQQPPPLHQTATPKPGPTPRVKPAAAPDPVAKSHKGMAVAALVCAMIGLSVVAGLIAGPAAIGLATSARQKMRESGNREGAGMALAAIIIGWVDIALGAILVIAGLASK